MHPIERLRYVARADWVPDRILVTEAVPGLAGFSRQPNALLVALRQLIGRQPESPGLLCLGARMIASLDPLSDAWALVDELEADQTADEADRVAAQEAGGVDLIETIASGPGMLVCPSGSTAWIASARAGGRNVIAITPRGSRLPRLLFDAFVRRLDLDGRTGAFELVPIDDVHEVLGPDGLGEASSWVADAPDVGELANF